MIMNYKRFTIIRMSWCIILYTQKISIIYICVYVYEWIIWSGEWLRQRWQWWTLKLNCCKYCAYYIRPHKIECEKCIRDVRTSLLCATYPWLATLKHYFLLSEQIYCSFGHVALIWLLILILERKINLTTKHTSWLNSSLFCLLPHIFDDI